MAECLELVDEVAGLAGLVDAVGVAVRAQVTDSGEADNQHAWALAFGIHGKQLFDVSGFVFGNVIGRWFVWRQCSRRSNVSTPSRSCT